MSSNDNIINFGSALQGIMTPLQVLQHVTNEVATQRAPIIPNKALILLLNQSDDGMYQHTIHSANMRVSEMIALMRARSIMCELHLNGR